MEDRIQLGRVDKTICRVCLQEKGTVLLTGVTEELFQYCTMIKVSKDDGLPPKLCRECAENLRVAYDFRFQAIYADKYFRVTFLGNRSAPTINERALSVDLNEKPKTDQITVIEELEEEVDNVEEMVIEQPLQDSIISEDETKIITEIPNSPIPIEEEEPEEFITQNESEENLSDHFSDYFTTAENGNVEAINQSEEHTIEIGSAPEEEEEEEEKDKSGNANTIDDMKDIKYDCNICGAVCAQMYSLKQHYMIHCGERPFICEFCDKAFTRPGVLRNHRRKHTGNLPYQCTQCAVSFANRIWLDRHKNREHNIEIDTMNRREYKCNKCPNVYNSKYTLNAHIRLQHPPERIKMQLAKHAMMAIENEETIIDETVLEPKLKPIMYQESLYSMGEFMCALCPSTFRRKFKLLEHLQTHENADSTIHSLLNDENSSKMSTEYAKDRKNNKTVTEQAFRCDCGKEFTRKSAMMVHKELHCTLGPFHCVCCEAVCSNIQALKKHLIDTHEEDIADQISPTFKCLVCGVGFNMFSTFINHLDVHDATKVYQCDQCILRFTKKFKFQYHLMTHHHQKAAKVELKVH